MDFLGNAQWEQVPPPSFSPGYKMKKRVGEIEEFAFDTLTEGRGLHITLAVSGWLSDDEPGEYLLRALCFYNLSVLIEFAYANS